MGQEKSTKRKKHVRRIGREFFLIKEFSAQHFLVINYMVTRCLVVRFKTLKAANSKRSPEIVAV